MSNYPLGAEHDPKAPWNELHEYCPYCDTEEMGCIARDMAAEKAKDANKSIKKYMMKVVYVDSVI